MVRRRRNCTHPADTACSWCANASLSVRNSNQHQVLLQRHLFTVIAIVITILILAITATWLVLQSWAIWHRRCRGWPDASTKYRARLTPHDTKKAREVSCKSVWVATSKPTSSQERGRTPSTDGEGTQTVAFDTRADTNVFNTCRDMYVRVCGTTGSTVCSMALLFRQLPLHHTHKRNSRLAATCPWPSTTPTCTSGIRPLRCCKHPTAASTWIHEQC